MLSECPASEAGPRPSNVALGRPRKNESMPSYSVNNRAVARARRLIDAHQYVVQSNWGEVQPSSDDENAYLRIPLVG
jgi:hypothetical protein